MAYSLHTQSMPLWLTAGQGTGIVWDSSYIVTNYHVISKLDKSQVGPAQQGRRPSLRGMAADLGPDSSQSQTNRPHVAMLLWSCFPQVAKVSVTDPQGKERLLDAQIVGTDTINDLAVLQVWDGLTTSPVTCRSGPGRCML